MSDFDEAAFEARMRQIEYSAKGLTMAWQRRREIHPYLETACDITDPCSRCSPVVETLVHCWQNTPGWGRKILLVRCMLTSPRGPRWIWRYFKKLGKLSDG